MYEFKGILCRHALKTLNQEKIQEIPESYLMRRWTRQAKIELLDTDNVSQSGVDEKCHIASRYQQLCRSLMHVADLASKSEEAYVCMRKVSRELLENVQLIHHQSVAAHEDQSKKMGANNEGKNHASLDTHKKLCRSVNIIFNKSGVNVIDYDEKIHLAKGIKRKPASDHSRRRTKGALKLVGKKRSKKQPTPKQKQPSSLHEHSM